MKLTYIHSYQSVPFISHIFEIPFHKFHSIFSGTGYPVLRTHSCTIGDIMKCEIDFDGGNILFYKNDFVVSIFPFLKNVLV